MPAESSLSLYSYFRSSAAYRVRIALALKGLEWTELPVNLIAGEERDPEYLVINPQGLVPALETAQGNISQSLAIIEYLEECYPQPPLLPADAFDRAKVRSLAYQVAMEIHPLNNLRVLQFLSGELGVAEDDKLRWYQHWITQGFSAFEATLNSCSNGMFCYGSAVTLADICLIPQVYNARRFECRLDDFPLIREIYQHCLTQQSFKSAAPQPGDSHN